MKSFPEILWERKQFVLVSAMIGMLIGIIVNFAVLKPVYRAQAKVIMESTQSGIDADRPGFEMVTSIVHSLPVGIRAAKIISAEEGRSRDESVLQRMGMLLMDNAIVSIDDNSRIILVAFEGPNPLQCYEYSNAYARAFAEVYEEYQVHVMKERIDDLNARIEAIGKDMIEVEKQKEKLEQGSDDARMLDNKLETLKKAYAAVEDKIVEIKSEDNRIYIVRYLEEARKPDMPISPNRKRNIILFTIFGLIPGFAWAYGMEKIKNNKEDESA